MQMRLGEAGGGGGGEDEKGGGCHRGGADHSLSLARRKYHCDPQTDRSHLINAGRTVSLALSAAGSAARRPELGIIKTERTKKNSSFEEPQCKNLRVGAPQGRADQRS